MIAEMPAQENQRLMLAAFRNCGRMSAARWLDHPTERSADDAAFIDRVTQRGDAVRVIDVPRGAALPAPICASGCSQCRDAGRKMAGLGRG